MSSHIGDLDDPETEQEYQSEIASLERIFDAEPEVVVCDLHPDYASTRFAHSLGLPLYFVQHHHAHFASVLAEQRKKEPAIGFIWDGTGLGNDGTIWGGETLFGSISGSTRVGHILSFRLPGGEAAIHEPWRAALSVCKDACGKDTALALFSAHAKEAPLLLQAAEAGLNAPQTTSMGRLFDAIAALAGLRETVHYEGQAAVELEQLAQEQDQEYYHFTIERGADSWVYDWRPVVCAARNDKTAGVSAGRISMRFHRALANLLAEAAEEHRRESGCSSVVLSGGCFQNELLLSLGTAALRQRNFEVLINQMVPCNDWGISYGQAATCNAIIFERSAPCASQSPEP